MCRANRWVWALTVVALVASGVGIVSGEYRWHDRWWDSFSTSHAKTLSYTSHGTPLLSKRSTRRFL